MRGVSRELPLRAHPALEPVQRLVDRSHERPDFVGDSFDRKADIGPLRPDRARLSRCLHDRPKRAPHDLDVDPEQEQEDRQGDPGDTLEKVRYDVVDQHVAMRKILGDLDPQFAAGDLLREARAGHSGVALAGSHVCGFGRANVLRKDRRAIAVRREQNLAASIHDGVSIAAVGLGIEVAYPFGQIEGPGAVRVCRNVLRDPIGLLVHRRSVERVGFPHQKQIERKRHQDRGAAHHDDVQPKDARHDRLETHAYFASAIM